MAKALMLEKAYLTESIPMNGAFIVSASFPDESAYAIYEITAYRIVKDVFQTDEGMVFKTDGNRTYMLVEPASYAQKHIEPVNRETGKAIPHRFSDIVMHTGRRSEKIMVPQEPLFLYSTFTVVEKGRDTYAYVFHATSDVYVAMKKFLIDSLRKDCGVDQHDAAVGVDYALTTIKKFTIWKN